MSGQGRKLLSGSGRRLEIGRVGHDLGPAIAEADDGAAMLEIEGDGAEHLPAPALHQGHIGLIILRHGIDIGRTGEEARRQAFALGHDLERVCGICVATSISASSLMTR